MQVKELQIEDWVYGLSHSPRKVQGLRDYNEENVVVADHWVNCNQLKPIPISDKFLVANGFEVANPHIGAWYRLHDNRMIFFTYHPLDDEQACSISTPEAGKIKTIRYIHEMQHALRLFGLGDLADNLIV